MKSRINTIRRWWDRIPVMRSWLLPLLLLAAGLPADVCFATPNFTASVDRTEIGVGEQVQLVLRFDDVTGGGPPQLPAIDGFTSQYVGPNTSIAIDNGVRTSSISHVFLLTAKREGTLVIPPFTVRLNDKDFSSPAIPIKVSKGGGQGPALADLFRMKLSVPRPELFLNEMVSVDLKFYIRSGIRFRTQIPTIATEGFSEIKLTRPVESQEVIEGKGYTVYTFRALTSPLRTGEVTLGPAETPVDVSVETQNRRRGFGFDSSLFDSVFGGGETRRVVIDSEPLKVQVRPLPDAGKPADFTGAIGRFGLDVTAKPTSLRAGEPVTLTIRVAGQGNLNMFAAPKFTPPEGFKSYDPLVKSKQTDEMGLTGEKVFEQVIVPLSSKAAVIPPVSFSFFDPDQGRYQTLSRGPIQLSVQDAPAGASAPVVVGAVPLNAAPRAPEKLGVGIVYLKPDLGTLVSTAPAWRNQSWFLAFQSLPAIAWLASVIVQRRRQRLHSDVRYARARRAFGAVQRRLTEAERLMQSGQGAAFYEELFKALQEYLGDRLNLPSSGITSEVVELQLRPRQVPADVCEALQELFTACDTAKFAPDLQNGLGREQSLKLARETIAVLEKVTL